MHHEFHPADAGGTPNWTSGSSGSVRVDAVRPIRDTIEGRVRRLLGQLDVLVTP